jgi:GGDEF domain-containing protein
MGSLVFANLGIAQATVATLGAVMIIGLGFLQRPSRAALLWSLAFLLAMVATWTILVGEAVDENVRRIGLGVILGAPALIWSGFRARRGAASFAWISPLQAAAGAGALVVVTDPTLYGLTFRVVFFAAAVFAGLTLREIHRSPDRHEYLVVPLKLVSATFVVLGSFSLLAGLIFPVSVAADLELIRLLNALGLLVYLVCATTSLLFFTSVSPVGAQTASSWPQFVVTATDRLRRARRSGESSWALLAVQLDDPDDIRGAAGDAAFAEIVRRFETLVGDAFPAEADIGREGRGRLIIVVSRPGPVLREHIRDLLRRVTEIEETAHLAIQMSASVGWAPADIVGYDFEALLSAAVQAGDEASERGGDRWQRIGA